MLTAQLRVWGCLQYAGLFLYLRRPLSHTDFSFVSNGQIFDPDTRNEPCRRLAPRGLSQYCQYWSSQLVEWLLENRSCSRQSHLIFCFAASFWSWKLHPCFLNFCSSKIKDNKRKFLSPRVTILFYRRWSTNVSYIQFWTKYIFRLPMWFVCLPIFHSNLCNKSY